MPTIAQAAHTIKLFSHAVIGDEVERIAESLLHSSVEGQEQMTHISALRRELLTSLDEKKYQIIFIKIAEKTISYTQAIYQALIALAQLKPLNEEDPSTLEIPPVEFQIYVSSGHRYDIRELITIMNTRRAETVIFNPELRAAMNVIPNLFTNKPFNEYDLEAIIIFATSLNLAMTTEQKACHLNPLYILLALIFAFGAVAAIGLREQRTLEIASLNPIKAGCLPWFRVKEIATHGVSSSSSSLVKDSCSIEMPAEFQGATYYNFIHKSSAEFEDINVISGIVATSEEQARGRALNMFPFHIFSSIDALETITYFKDPNGSTAQDSGQSENDIIDYLLQGKTALREVNPCDRIKLSSVSNRYFLNKMKLQGQGEQKNINQDGAPDATALAANAVIASAPTPRMG